MIDLAACRRIVIKVGSALLVDAASGLKRDWLDSLTADIAKLRENGAEVLLVSSGAIALGRSVLQLPRRPLRLDESQAAAAIGQIALARAWSESLDGQNLKTGQILLTLPDTEGRDSRRSYLNARDTIERLLSFGAIPVINENDTIATSEIRYGDNDRLAARVTSMMGADCLILLSDVDGLYTAPPADNPDAEFVAEVHTIDATIEAMAGSAGTELSRGGMQTKVEAAKIATAAGATMIIASGKRLSPVSALTGGERATLFHPSPVAKTARKKWIAGQLEAGGSLVIDAGAASALERGKSLLPAGVTAIDGQFQRGDTVEIRSVDGHVLGHGLVGYDSSEAKIIAGHGSGKLTELLGYEGRATMIHRNDMALSQRKPVETAQ